MQKPFYVIVTLLFSLYMYGQQSTYKFDFGAGKASKGYLKVTPETVYSTRSGYGFDYNVKVRAVSNGGKGVTGDYITAKQPFYFSVKLPEGNYDVKLVLGDTKGSSATTVRVECRRLMLENIKTLNGNTTEKTFTVHVRDSMIRDNKGTVTDGVKLKPREGRHLQWDDKLTIEFNDSLPKVCAIEITPNTTAATLFLAGDSTVTDQPDDPYASWGQMFPVFLDPLKAAVANYAESGETLLAFENEKRFKKIFSMAKPGDYLFIEFTHNDQKPGVNHLEPFTTFRLQLKKWITEAKNNMMIPVLVTSTHRRNFDANGNIVNTLLEYPEAMRQTAKEESVALIDLNTMSKIFYEAMGEKESVKAFVHYPANTFPGQVKELKDNTHFNPYGAYQLAQCVVSTIKKQHLPLSTFIAKNTPEYDPLRPTPFIEFYWPQSGFINSSKPDGN